MQKKRDKALCSRTWVALLFTACLASTLAWAHPEFQIYSEQISNRNVNCSMCHTHPDGPEGLRSGQIGSLNKEGMEQLMRARAAFEPGMGEKNPLLNDFGNHILDTLGKAKILELIHTPAQLPEALGNESDLDGDGISDAQEYLHGTHPLDPHHGDPWLLSVNNLQRNCFHLLMITLATASTLYGLNHLLHWAGRILGGHVASEEEASHRK